MYGGVRKFMSRTATMCGWFSELVSSASRWKRAMASLSRARCGRSALMATGRWRIVFSPSKTAPMPPSPIFRPTR